MIVMIKSAPDTSDGAIGLALAKQGGADRNARNVVRNHMMVQDICQLVQKQRETR